MSIYDQLSSERVKSYATAENLEKALKKLGFDTREHMAMRCRTVEGRWTAIFPRGAIQDGNLMRYGYHGFMTIG